MKTAQIEIGSYRRGGMVECESNVSKISNKMKVWTLKILLKNSYVVDDFQAVTFFQAREQACIKYHTSRHAVISEGYREL